MQMTPVVVLGHTVTIALSNLLNQLVTKSVLNNEPVVILRVKTKDREKKIEARRDNIYHFVL